ncbi:MAG TPA: HAD-IIIA family hydrolase [Polyangia bacterium]|nr:HAD-IIIA family hydrolase [Polyangia bacterium]
MDTRLSLIVLDRDGVLNQLVDNPAEPRPDSPMRVSQVTVFPWVPHALRDLTQAGFGIVIASNQPSAAKGKTTRADLEAVHAAVLRQAQSRGGIVLSSHICYHRSEEACLCRKPAPGLLAEAFVRHAGYDVAASWMVGDRAVDVLAGAAFGVRTALLSPVGSDERAALAARGHVPHFLGEDLRDFARFALSLGR